MSNATDESTTDKPTGDPIKKINPKGVIESADAKEFRDRLLNLQTESHNNKTLLETLRTALAPGEETGKEEDKTPNFMESALEEFNEMF